MNKETSKDTGMSGFRHTLRTNKKVRRRITWVGGMAGLCVLVLVAIPVITTRVAISWLQDNGASEASIENIDINLFTGTVRLFGLDASDSAGQQFRIGQAELGIRWWPLVKKRIAIETVRLSAAYIDISTDASGNWQIGAINLHPSEPVSEDSSANNDEGLSWDFGTEIITVNDVYITYADPLLSSDIDVREFIVGNQSTWLAEEKTDVSLDMRVNDAPIRLNSEAALWAQQRSFAGTLSVNEFDLGVYAQALQLLAGVENARGMLAMDLSLNAVLHENGVLELKVSGPLTLDGSSFAMESLALSNQQISWLGDLDLNFPAPENQPMLLADGDIRLTDTQVSLADMTVSNRILDWQGEVTVSTTEANNTASLFMNATGELEAEETAATMAAMAFVNEAMTWQGVLDLDLAAQADPMLFLDGALQVNGSSVSLSDFDLTASINNIGLLGNVSFSPAPPDPLNSESSLPTLALEATVSGQGLSIHNARLPFNLARMEAFDFRDIKVSDMTQVSMQQLQLQGLQLLAAAEESAQTPDNVFRFEQLLLEQFRFTASDGIKIDSVILSEPGISIVRNEASEFERISALLAIYSAADEVEAGTEQILDEAVITAEKSQLAFAINSLQIDAQNLLSFGDRSVTPEVQFPLTVLNLSLNNIDTASSNPATLKLSLGNTDMSLDVEGDLSAFAELPSVALIATLTSLDLPQFSAYIPGYNLDRGRFSADSTISIIGDELDIKNTVRLDRLRLSGKAAEGNDILSQGMAMPLDVALDLLRDSNDRIELALPVTGSLSDPEFSTADIFRTVMQNALQNAAMSYVTNALQPLGTLLFVKNLASQAAQPRFAPLEMDAGESMLTPTGREYLLKIGDLLTERPSMALTLCGIATESDRAVLGANALAEPVLSEQTEAGPDTVSQTDQETPVLVQIPDADLLQLARLRTAVSIDFLTDEANIPAERLFSCRETIDDGEDVLPGVQISL